jgi:hypothetical protein
MEEVEEAALLPAAPTLRSGKLDRPVQYRFFRRSNFLALRDGRRAKGAIDIVSTTSGWVRSLAFSPDGRGLGCRERRQPDSDLGRRASKDLLRSTSERHALLSNTRFTRSTSTGN